MMNERPIENPELQEALDLVKAIMAKYNLAGACMLVAPEEAAFTYGLHTPWSALRPDPTTPLGFRFTAISKRDGKELTQRRVEAALHIICQLADFGEQTKQWMEDVKAMLRKNGIDFDHTSFGGKPLPHLDQLT